MKVWYLVVFVTALSACTSSPSSRIVPNNRSYSIGVDFGLTNITNPIIPLIKVNFDYRINDALQTGMSFMPGPTNSYLEPYILLKAANIGESGISLYPFVSFPYSLTYPEITVKKSFPLSVGASLYYRISPTANVFTTWSYNSSLEEIDNPFTHPKVPFQGSIGVDNTSENYHYFVELMEVGQFNYFVLNSGMGYQH